MREVARLPESDRRDLFRETAARMKVQPAIAEKDFWVCWTLDYLFHDCAHRDRFGFKGGTSLSKAYGAIERFSEDIDLILDWRLLGYKQDEPWLERSHNQQSRFSDEANARAESWVRDTLVPLLQSDLSNLAGVPIEVSIESDTANALIRYPRAFDLDAIRPEICIEVGPLADWMPNTEMEIRPYAAEHFPKEFARPVTRIRTIDAARTFWEKVTILHQEAHRSTESALPQRYSRHYYDVYRLSQSAYRAEALNQLDLLDKVVEFKRHFYHSAWANFEAAKPGSLCLLPSDAHRASLEEDYRAMGAMLFGAVPTFDEIINELTELENAINALGPSP